MSQLGVVGGQTQLFSGLFGLSIGPVLALSGLDPLERVVVELALDGRLIQVCLLELDAPLRIVSLGLEDLEQQLGTDLREERVRRA